MQIRNHSPKKSLVSIASFIPIQILGKGSFGEVYLVRHKCNGKLYAMKVISKYMIAKQNISRYINTEKNIQSSLNSPFIVKLHCTFQTKTRLFMVMDYLRGGDLTHSLRKAKRFSESIARMYAAEILLAIQELHKHKIIYRDLKPDNIVLNEEGHSLLIDFGLAKEGVKDITGSFCGSLAYLAPEVLKRTGHGKSVDWYLLGVLIYEMIVGIPPYFDRDKIGRAHV